MRLWSTKEFSFLSSPLKKTFSGFSFAISERKSFLCLGIHFKSSWDRRQEKEVKILSNLQNKYEKPEKGKLALRRNFSISGLNGTNHVESFWRHFANNLINSGIFNVNINKRSQSSIISLWLLKTTTAWGNYGTSKAIRFHCWQNVNFAENPQRYSSPGPVRVYRINNEMMLMLMWHTFIRRIFFIHSFGWRVMCFESSGQDKYKFVSRCKYADKGIVFKRDHEHDA